MTDVQATGVEGVTGAGACPVESAFVDGELCASVMPLLDSVLPDVTGIEDASPGPGEALRRLVKRYGEAGLLRLVVPQAFGGGHAEVQSAALCLVRERLGHRSPLADLAFGMQALGSYPITLLGDEELKGAWLPKVVRGDAVAAFALTEPEAGTDLGGMTTTARREGGGYVLDGHKVFISNAGVADFYSLFAVTDSEAEPKRRLSAFVIPADAPGLTTSPTDVLGGHPIGEVRLSGVRLPANARIGDEGDGMRVALGTLHRLRPTVGAAAIGFAQRALDETVAHVRARRQFGAPLAELPIVQAHLGDMACDIEASRLLVYRAAAAADAAADRSVVARTGSMAKLAATEAAQRVIDCAVQLHGGKGVRTDSAVARLYEEVRALRIYEGTNDVQRLLIARELLRG